jgi:hypothetical protein
MAQKTPDSNKQGGLPTTPVVNVGRHASETGIVGQAKEKAGEVLEQAKDMAGDVLEQAKSTAGTLADRAKEQAAQKVTERKERAVGTLGNVASALRKTGEQMEGETPGVPQYLEMAASQFDNVQRYLQENDLRQVTRQVEGFARREPVLFLGGAFLLGVVAARFLKSSAPEQGSSAGGDWGDGYRVPSSTNARYGSTDDSFRTQSFRGDTVPQRTYAPPSRPAATARATETFGGYGGNISETGSTASPRTGAESGYAAGTTTAPATQPWKSETGSGSSGTGSMAGAGAGSSGGISSMSGSITPPSTPVTGTGSGSSTGNGTTTPSTGATGSGNGTGTAQRGRIPS